MRSFSFLTIILLCVGILLVDAMTFYWLQSIVQLVDSKLIEIVVNVFFVLFTVGLITSILVLKIKLDNISPMRKQLLISRFYGLGVLSFVPKLIFVIVFSILYSANLLLPKEISLIVIAGVGLFSGFLPFLVILYGILKTIYRFKVYHQKIFSSLLPTAFDGVRIVQLSDLHLGSFNFNYKKVAATIDEINALAPDYIFITGDVVNNYAWELRGWDNVFNRLEAREGKFAVLGNHDYGDYSEWKSEEDKENNSQKIKEFFKKINFTLLMNEAVLISKENEEIAIVGVENWGKPPFKQYGNLKKAMAGIDAVSYKILLSHDPTHWTEKVKEKADIVLTLSGHTHGMQAAFQYKNLQWSPIKYKYKHWAGLYQHKNQYLYVNRGFGWLGFPGRIGVRPEITLIELKTKN